MRWSYSNFPDGLPGLGLLLLRAAIGVQIMIHAFSWIVEPQSASMGLWALGLLGLLIGAAFLSGFLTPIISAFSVLAGIVVQFWFPGSEPTIATLLGFNTIVMALAICLLGTWSVFA